MMRFLKKGTAVLLAVLMVCSMITITLPNSGIVEAASSSSETKWTAGSGASVLSESSITWVTDTVKVDLKGINGYVQLDQILADLIGKNGEDGQGYVQIIPEEPTTVFAFAQLVTQPSATNIDPASDTRAMTWYLRSNENNVYSTIHLRGSTAFALYGNYADCADEGYMFAFTTTANGNVAIRGNGKKTGSGFDAYSDTTSINSVKKLAELVGEGTKSGEDGVYFRLQSYTSTSTNNFKYTIKVVYPKPATSTVDANKDSRWTAGGGAEIISETHEAMVYDTVRVDLAADPGYVQHHVKLTELIGSNGEDGKGYIKIMPDDITNDFSFIQLVGNPEATGIVPEGDTKGMTWYMRSNETGTFSTIHLRGSTANRTYGNYADFQDEGYIFAFTQTANGNVAIRGAGEKTAESFNDYADTTSLISVKKLSDIQGVGIETGEDGVYFRIRSFGGTTRNQKHTITIAYPEPEGTPDAPVMPGEPVNLVPEDIFSSYDKTALWFKGALNTDASYYTVEDGEYVAHFPRTDNWTYSTRIPTGEFTAEFEVCPVEKDSGALASIGVMLGKNAGGGFPWMNAQIQFKPKTANSYVEDGIFAQHWYHSGVTEGTHSKVYTSEPLFIGSEYVTTAKWYKVRIEIGAESSAMYVDGVLVPNGVNNYMPTADEIKYLGFWPEGSSNGFKIKNYKLYEGVRKADTFMPEEVFDRYETARVWFTNASSDATHYTVDNGENVMRVPLIANGGGWMQTTRAIPYDEYTVSYDFSMVALNDTKLAGVGNLVGVADRHWYSLRFDAYTNGKLQFRIIELDDTLAIKQDLGFILEDVDFSSKKWFNLTYKVTENSFKVFLDGELLYSSYLDGKLNSQNIQYFGFFPEGGTAGFDVKNFSAVQGAGVEADIEAAIPELNDAITLHIQTKVDTESTEPVRMKFNFKGEAIWADAEVSDTQYIFSLPEILPQDMGENISAELYVGDVLKDIIPAYSMKAYCMNQLASSTDEDGTLRALLVSILNYGAEAQLYFEKDVENLATSELTDVQKGYLSNYDINQATGVVTDKVTGTPDENYTWNAATLGLYDLIKVRFKFTATDIANTRIQIGDVIYDAEDFASAGGGKYIVYSEGIFATDFDKTITAMFIDEQGNQIGEKVEYSVNTYLSYINGLQESAAKDIVQAIYNYGMASALYGK